MKRNLFTKKTALFALILAVAAVVTIPIATGGSSGDEEGHVNPTAIGPAALITSGSAGGIDWALYAYESDRGLCFEQRYSGAVRSTSQSCGAVPRGRSLRAAVERFGPGGNAAGQFVYGLVRGNVGRVEVELASGRTIAARPVAAPAALGPVAFFVAASAAADEVNAVRATDRSGRLLETYRPEARPTSGQALPTHG